MNTSKKKETKTAGRRPLSQKQNEDTRAIILNAARHVFARRGVDGSSVREIAKMAHVNNAMIYYHFKSKTDLYRAVLENSFKALDCIWTHTIFQTSASARQKIQKYIEEFIRFEQTNDELRKIMSMEFTASGMNTRWIADNYFRHHYLKLVSILKSGMKSGELKKIDPTVAIVSLLGMISQNFISKPVAEYVARKKMDLSVTQFGKFIAMVFFDGLAHKSSKRAIRKK